MMTLYVVGMPAMMTLYVGGMQVIQQSNDGVMSDLVAGVLDGGAMDDTATLADAAAMSDLPEGIERVAFGVWAFTAGEDMRMTQALVRDRTGETVPLATLRGWRDSHNWGDVAAACNQALSTTAVVAVRRIMTVGAVRAASWLAGCFDDEGISPMVKVKAAAMLLDRGGFPALIRSEIFAGVEARGGDLAGMSDAELAAEWVGYASGHGVDSIGAVGDVIGGAVGGPAAGGGKVSSRAARVADDEVRRRISLERRRGG